ncbi:Protein of unknown function (DUF1415) [Fragilaria crotonensis]|nr:Protein of unknown function (DUF1415) [Fragilaria crotonensis]
MSGTIRCLGSAFFQRIGKRQFCSSADSRIAATQRWFETVVIGEKLCPFAPPFLQNPSLMRIISSHATNSKEAVEVVSTEVQQLVGPESSPSHETTLIVFEYAPWSADFRDFIRLSWQLQEEAVGQEFVDEVQLVLFHPEASHQTYGYHGDDPNPADFTIRSPFPTVHLLRQVDVLHAVKSGYPNLETLPSRNQQKMLQQGLEVCTRRLQACHYADASHVAPT